MKLLVKTLLGLFEIILALCKLNLNLLAFIDQALFGLAALPALHGRRGFHLGGVLITTLTKVIGLLLQTAPLVIKRQKLLNIYSIAFVFGALLHQLGILADESDI